MTMIKSDSVENLFKDLIEAQTELKNPDRNKEGRGYKYADLASIIDQVKPVLQKHGLTITQTACNDDNGRVGVTTILGHSTGEFISDTLNLPIPEMLNREGKKIINDTQAAGAAITYARRYAISSILNIAADEDTDAAVKEDPNKGVWDAPVIKLCQMCGSQMRYVEGVSKKSGKPFKGWFCTKDKSHPAEFINEKN